MLNDYAVQFSKKVVYYFKSVIILIAFNIKKVYKINFKIVFKTK